MLWQSIKKLTYFCFKIITNDKFSYQLIWFVLIVYGVGDWHDITIHLVQFNIRNRTIEQFSIEYRKNKNKKSRQTAIQNANLTIRNIMTAKRFVIWNIKSVVICYCRGFIVFIVVVINTVALISLCATHPNNCTQLNERKIILWMNEFREKDKFRQTNNKIWSHKNREPYIVNWPSGISERSFNQIKCM